MKGIPEETGRKKEQQEQQEQLLLQRSKSSWLEAGECDAPALAGEISRRDPEE
jgi:hypothetical protein